MSDIQIYLLEVDKNKDEARNVVASCARRLETKQLKLIDLVTSLEEYINNKNDGAQRAKSIGFLADILEALAAQVLSGQERRLLCDFILGRLENDLEGIGASARALIALEGLGKWDAETAQKALTTFLDHANPLRQFKLQTDRYSVIQLIDMLLAKYRHHIRQLQDSDPNLLPNVIAFFDGEKDPRNLMVVFSLLQVPMTEWDITAHAQDLFETVFNYFPITFKPPPDDPYGITAQDLKNRLRACMACNSDFAPFAFPQLLDKLDSTSMNTKRDVLQAMQACVINYEAKTINLYSVTLWDALKFEILNVQEEDLAEGALQTLALIAAKFAPGEEGPLNAYLRPIIKECNEHLEDAPTKQSQAAGRILNSLAATSPVVADRLAKGVLPTLFALYQSSESITKRRGLLEAFNQLVKAYQELQRDTPAMSLEVLQSTSSKALGFMLRALSHAPKTEVSFRLASLDGLVLMLGINKLLSDADIHLAVDTITEIILHERVDGHGDIRSQAIKSLTSIAHGDPQAVQDRSVPAFMVALPESPGDETSYMPVLEAFAQLSTERQIFETVVLRLKNKFLSAHAAKAPVEYQKALLLALLYAFTLGAPAQENDCIRSDYYAEYVQPLVELIKGQDADFAIETTGRVCNAILRPQGVHFQSTVYASDLAWLSLVSDSTDAHRMTPFFLHYYSALRPEVADASSIAELLNRQTKQVLSSEGPPASSLRLIALLLNKFVNPKTAKATLEASGIEVEALLGIGNPSPQVVATSFAVTKALIVQGRAAPLSTQYLNSILALLQDPLNTYTAKCFATLLAPDEILSKENHCLVSGLYKQKLFNHTVAHLTEGIRTQKDPIAKANHLIALSGILRWLPYSILQPSLRSLTPPLLQTLDLSTKHESRPATSAPSSRDFQEVKTSSLTIFESILMHDADIVAEHTSSLVTRLLNATAAPTNQGPVRAKALQCLSLVPRQLKTQAVVPYRRQVVQRLIACLDDAKRNVRSEAVKCRKAWLALDDGAEDDE